MSGLITTTNAQRTLLGGTYAVAGMAFNRYDSIEKKLFAQIKTNNRFHEILTMRSRPLGSTTGEGQQRSHVDVRQLWVHKAWINYFESNIIITDQAKRFMTNKQLLADIVSRSTDAALALAMAKEKAAMDIFNNYDSTAAAYLYGSGKGLASTTQKTGDGSTYSNLASAAAQCNETSLEAAQTVIRAYKDTGGKPIKVGMYALLGGFGREFEFARVLDSTMTLGSNFNDPNIINTRKYVKGGDHVSPFFTDDGSWAIITDLNTNPASGLSSNGVFTATAIDFEMQEHTPDGLYATEICSRMWSVSSVDDQRGAYIYPRA